LKQKQQQQQLCGELKSEENPTGCYCEKKVEERRFRQICATKLYSYEKRTKRTFLLNIKKWNKKIIFSLRRKHLCVSSVC
jgi:hypothetical protein